MTTRARVQAYGRQGYVTVTPEATYGATIGANVFNADGSLFVPQTVMTPAESEVEVTVWRLILEVPPNVRALESATGSGLFAVTGPSVGAMRAIQPVAGQTTVTNGDGVAANPAIGLATVADAGGGTLLRIVRDDWGRITGTSTPTTTDLAEGTNLYHTAARVRDTVLTGLSTATNAVIAATDSVLGALGKLQAQISNIIATYVPNTRTISTTAPLTGGGDLSANRTLAISAATTGAAGSMSAADKAKLDGVAEGATANATDAQLRDRATHTGTQLAATVSDFTAAARTAAVADALADGVTNVAPSQNAVFDALAIPKGYIDGLQMQWVSGTALTVTSGAAYIESLSRVVAVPSAIAKSGLSLSASAWYHVYLFDNAGTPDVEIVTTAPSSPYNGTARSKTGDASRRYLGSVRTGGAAVIQNFKQTLNDVLYVNAPLRALDLGTATTRTSVSASGGLPETAFMLKANASNSDAGLYVFWYHPSSASALRATAPSADNSFELPLNAAQEFQYEYTGGTPTGGAYLDICGYSFER